MNIANGTEAPKKTRKRKLTKREAALAASQWVDVIRSTIAAVLLSIDATRCELRKKDSPLDGVLDDDQLNTLARDMRDAEVLANCLSCVNPLDIYIPSALTQPVGERTAKGGAPC